MLKSFVKVEVGAGGGITRTRILYDPKNALEAEFVLGEPSESDVSLGVATPHMVRYMIQNLTWLAESPAFKQWASEWKAAFEKSQPKAGAESAPRHTKRKKRAKRRKGSSSSVSTKISTQANSAASSRRARSSASTSATEAPAPSARAARKEPVADTPAISSPIPRRGRRPNSAKQSETPSSKESGTSTISPTMEDQAKNFEEAYDVKPTTDGGKDGPAPESAKPKRGRPNKGMTIVPPKATVNI